MREQSQCPTVVYGKNGVRVVGRVERWCQGRGDMTGVNEVVYSGIGRMWCVFPCVWCSMMTEIFVLLYNACVVRVVLLRIKGP